MSWSLTNGTITPEQFPMVNCNPLAAVLLPYLGEFPGNHDNGSPTAVYNPTATRKHPKYLAAGDAAVSRIVYPVKDTRQATIVGNARLW